MTKKLYYYVLILDKDLETTNKYTANYVTNIEFAKQYCSWNCEYRPLAMDKATANDIAYGLTLNGYNAIVVNYTYEI